MKALCLVITEDEAGLHSREGLHTREIYRDYHPIKPGMTRAKALEGMLLAATLKFRDRKGGGKPISHLHD